MNAVAAASDVSAGAGASTTIPGRIPAIDMLRGAVMVLMALDHVRDFVTDARFSPENLQQASFALFATRWVTHFCAPIFFLLAGVGAGILRSRGTSPGALGRFLLARGIWLLVLELIVTPVGWQFGFQLIPAFALVLWALGWSMIVLALIVHLPLWLIAALSLVMIGGHNLLDGLRPDQFGALAGLWHVLHVPGFAVQDTLFVAYPLVPWIAVMALGYVLAAVYTRDVTARRRLLLWSGVAATLLFIALRWINGYGDPVPWGTQRTPLLTFASFLNVRKYPPSLDFLLMTLGPALAALALAEGRREGPAGRFLAIYGRVPLFFYVTHIFVAHALAVLLAFVQGGEWRTIPVVTDPASIPAWYGLPLPGVYLMWALVVAILYVPCRKFGELKRGRSEWWLRYL